MKNFLNKIQKIFLLSSMGVLKTKIAFAEANAEIDLENFLTDIGTWLITVVGPTVLVIGVSLAGVSMALGDERGMQRGFLAAAGGALILLSRAVLSFLQNATNFGVGV